MPPTRHTISFETKYPTEKPLFGKGAIEQHFNDGSFVFDNVPDQTEEKRDQPPSCSRYGCVGKREVQDKRLAANGPSKSTWLTHHRIRQNLHSSPKWGKTGSQHKQRNLFMFAFPLCDNSGCWKRKLESRWIDAVGKEKRGARMDSSSEDENGIFKKLIQWLAKIHNPEYTL